MITRRETITISGEMDLEENTPRLLREASVALSDIDEIDCYDLGLVYYLINAGQTGLGKVMGIYTNLSQAEEALASSIDPCAEIRVGMLVEGCPIKVQRGKKSKKVPVV